MNTIQRAVALLAALTLSSCSTVDVLGLLDDQAVIFLAQETPPNAVMEALYEGRVAVDSSGCVRLVGPGASTVVWPYGFSLDRDSPTARVLDADGKVVGRLSGSFKFGGGHVPYLHEGIDIQEGMRDRATTECPGYFWVVGDIVED